MILFAKLIRFDRNSCKINFKNLKKCASLFSSLYIHLNRYSQYSKGRELFYCNQMKLKQVFLVFWFFFYCSLKSETFSCWSTFLNFRKLSGVQQIKLMA